MGWEEVTVLPKMQTATLLTPRTGPRQWRGGSGGLEAGKKRGQVLNQRGKQEAEGSEGDMGGYKDPAPKLSCLFLVRVPGGPGLQDLHVACVEGGMLKTQLLAQDRGSAMGCGLWRGAPEKDTAQGTLWGAGLPLVGVQPHRHCCSRPAGWKCTCIFRCQFSSVQSLSRV